MRLPSAVLSESIEAGDTSDQTRENQGTLWVPSTSAGKVDAPERGADISTVPVGYKPPLRLSQRARRGLASRGGAAKRRAWPCPLREALMKARDATAHVLESYSLEQAAEHGVVDLLEPVA